jgi:hypothetical protein
MVEKVPVELAVAENGTLGAPDNNVAVVDAD